MAYHLRVGIADAASAERKIVYGIENIGLTHPIVADKTIYLRREVESDLTDVLIVQYGKFFEYHCLKMHNFSAKLQVFGGKSKKSRNKISLSAYFLLILPRICAYRTKNEEKNKTKDNKWQMLMNSRALSM